MRSFENSSDTHDLASIAWNNGQFNIRYTYYKSLHSCSLFTNSSFGRAAMPLGIDFHQTEYIRWIVSKPQLVKLQRLTQLCFLN